MLKHCFFRLLAAFIFFTRLPFWRLAQVPKEYYERVVPLWPLVGWLTGGCMATTFYWGTQCFTPLVGLLLALLVRILMTGALHEDGLADVCDGFGGGTSRDQILRIMKDSHIGTYGVLGLILYFLLMSSVLYGLTTTDANGSEAIEKTVILIFCADPCAKYLCSHIVNVLPYARKAEEAKTKLVYTRTPWTEECLGLCFGLAPSLMFLPPLYWWCIPGAAVCTILLFGLFKKNIQGYTGDCCGAGFLLTELCFLLIALAIALVR